jgi:hypothetical protein
LPLTNQNNNDFFDKSNFSDENNTETSKIKDFLPCSIWIQEFINQNTSMRRMGFHSRFSTLKKYLGLSTKTRKTQIDSLLKKCKSKFFKNVHKALKNCLRTKLEKLPQNFITNIKIEFNKSYINKTLLEIYEEFKIFTSIEELHGKNLIRDDKFGILKELMSMTFRDAFENYITSKMYLRDYEIIQEKEDEKFAILFNYISRIFIQYYTYSKGNKPKNMQKSRIRLIKNQKHELFAVVKGDNINI